MLFIPNLVSQIIYLALLQPRSAEDEDRILSDVANEGQLREGVRVEENLFEDVNQQWDTMIQWCLRVCRCIAMSYNANFDFSGPDQLCCILKEFKGCFPFRESEEFTVSAQVVVTSNLERGFFSLHQRHFFDCPTGKGRRHHVAVRDLNRIVEDVFKGWESVYLLIRSFMTALRAALFYICTIPDIVLVEGTTLSPMVLKILNRKQKTHCYKICINVEPLRLCPLVVTVLDMGAPPRLNARQLQLPITNESTIEPCVNLVLNCAIVLAQTPLPKVNLMQLMRERRLGTVVTVPQLIARCQIMATNRPCESLEELAKKLACTLAGSEGQKKAAGTAKTRGISSAELFGLFDWMVDLARSIFGNSRIGHESRQGIFKPATLAIFSSNKMTFLFRLRYAILLGLAVLFCAYIKMIIIYVFAKTAHYCYYY